MRRANLLGPAKDARTRQAGSVYHQPLRRFAAEQRGITGTRFAKQEAEEEKEGVTGSPHDDDQPPAASRRVEATVRVKHRHQRHREWKREWKPEWKPERDLEWEWEWEWQRQQRFGGELLLFGVMKGDR